MCVKQGLHMGPVWGRANLSFPAPSTQPVNAGGQLFFSVGQSFGLCSPSTMQDTKWDSRSSILLVIEKPAWGRLGRTACCWPFRDLTTQVS